MTALVILTIAGLLGVILMQQAEIREWKRASAYWQGQAGEWLDQLRNGGAL